MGKEALYVPEEDLQEVISVIRAGLERVRTSEYVRQGLLTWCEDEEAYLARLSALDDDT